MSITSSHGWAKFNLRGVFETMTAFAVVLLVCVQIPSPAFLQALRNAPALLLFSALFALLPLTCINLVCVVVAKVSSSAGSMGGPVRRFRLLAPHTLLLQAAAEEPPPLRICLLIACACTMVTALLWPLMRELGLALALMFTEGFSAGESTLTAIPRLLVDQSFVWRVFRWELFSMLRWWCFFGSLAAIWLAASWPLRKHVSREASPVCIRRLLAFAPWLVIIEIAFLIGVWTRFARVVPEPSTGFVVGIFSWDLWHWDCWKGIVWINRGMMPAFVIATLFYLYVLRWRWSVAIPTAACSVPLALILSVAWSVLYSELFH